VTLPSLRAQSSVSIAVMPAFEPYRIFVRGVSRSSLPTQVCGLFDSRVTRLPVHATPTSFDGASKHRLDTGLDTRRGRARILQQTLALCVIFFARPRVDQAMMMTFGSSRGRHTCCRMVPSQVTAAAIRSFSVLAFCKAYCKAS
jgi:hypothetical protein